MFRVRRSALLLAPLLVVALGSSSSGVCVGARSLDPEGRAPKPSKRELPHALTRSAIRPRTIPTLDQRGSTRNAKGILATTKIRRLSSRNGSSQPTYLQSAQSSGLTNDVAPPGGATSPWKMEKPGEPRG